MTVAVAFIVIFSLVSISSADTPMTLLPSRINDSARTPVALTAPCLAAVRAIDIV